MKTSAKRRRERTTILTEIGADHTPDNPQHYSGLSPEQTKIALAILEKHRVESWGDVIAKQEISCQQLFDLQQEPRLQEAVYNASLLILRSDFPDVLKALTIKAKEGDNAAMRLFFELAGGLRETPPFQAEVHPVDIIIKMLGETQTPNDQRV